MKSLFILPLLILVVQGTYVFDQIKENTDQEDFIYFNRVLYNAWNGYVKGLYNSKAEHTVDENCFGEWIALNLTHIGDVLDRAFNGSWVPYEESKEAAIDVVNLFYKNQHFCKFTKVYNDTIDFCGEEMDECFDDA